VTDNVTGESVPAWWGGRFPNRVGDDVTGESVPAWRGRWFNRLSDNVTGEPVPAWRGRWFTNRVADHMTRRPVCPDRW
jgi:hypothetical protein